MATTVSVSEETRRALMRVKLEEGAKSVDELVARLLIDHKKMKFLEEPDRFRRALKESGLRIRDLME